MSSLVAVLGLAPTACLGSDFEDSVEGSWELESGTHDGRPVPILDTHPITMTLNAADIGGTAACNTYSGRYMLSGSEFSIEDGLSFTEMACQPTEVMESEQKFLEALTSISEVELTNDGLVLRGPDTELAFVQLDG